MEKRVSEEFRKELFNLKMQIRCSSDLNQIQKLRQEMTRLKKQEKEKELLKQEKGKSK